MIQGRSILAIIPARGGSKAVKDKNIRPLAGRPLIAWTIDAAKKSKYVDRILVSTDSKKIAAIAEACGADVPFLRPARLAADDTPGNDVIVHCLKWLERNEHRAYVHFLFLQPTSPFRTAEQIDGAIETIVGRPKAKALVSVVEAKEHPRWMMIIDGRGRLKPFLPGGRIARRQELPRIYALNGAIYIGTTKTFLADLDFYAGTCLPFIMDRTSSVDIDDEEDFAFAEFLIARRRA